jgi:hypothetical protein
LQQLNFVFKFADILWLKNDLLINIVFIIAGDLTFISQKRFWKKVPYSGYIIAAVKGYQFITFQLSIRDFPSVGPSMIKSSSCDAYSEYQSSA